MVEFFIDTSNINDIERFQKLGIINGCTTNPKILYDNKGEKGFEETFTEILNKIKGPVSIEVTTNNVEEMVQEALKYSQWGKNVVIKLPLTEYGLIALNRVKEKVKTNLTMGMTSSQALLASKAGATYVSLFYGRIRDYGENPFEVVKETRSILDTTGLESKIIVGSIRTQKDVVNATKAGAHIITITPKILEKMLYHPMTEYTEKEFLEFWKKYKEGK